MLTCNARAEVNGGTLNAGTDATFYITADNNNDWAIIVDKYRSSATEYGIETRVASGASYALSVLGNGSRVFRVGGNGDIVNSGSITASGSVSVNGTYFKFPTGTSDPTGSTGYTYFNTSSSELRIYNGTVWGGIQFSTGTQSNPATSASNLNATGALAQYWFSPDGGTAFQNYACGALSNLGTVPSGGPSWVSNISSLVIIEKGQIGTNSTMRMSRANYFKFNAESDGRTNNTCYIYWSVWDNGTLWGITRTRWTGITASSWESAHGSQGVDNSTLNGTPYWDVWKTGSGTAGGTISSGSYTISNSSSLVRAVAPGDNHNGSSTSKGLHYKRLGDGEHYPWFNSSGVQDNGYFYPSSSYAMGSDSRYLHYLFLSDT